MSAGKKNEALQLFAVGLAHQKAGRLADARCCYERGLKCDPGNPDALFLLGQTLFDSGDASSGERKMRAGIAARPQAANYRAGLALSLFNANRMVEAVVEFGLAVRAIPNDPTLWRGLAMSAVQSGELETALDAVEHWLRLLPADTDALRLRATIGAQLHFDQASVLAAGGQVEAACQAYEIALQYEPGATPILVNLANLYTHNQRPEEARQLYERAIAFAPEYASAHFNLGMLHLDEGRRLDATQCLSTAVELEPGNGLFAAHLLFQKMHLCRWDGLDELSQRVIFAIENNTVDIPPFIVLSMPGTTPQLQRKCAENHSAWLRREGLLPPRESEHRQHERLRVGYLSSDFKNHATAFLMIDMLEAHDRSRFEIYGLSYGLNDHSPMRARVEASVEHFVELAGLSMAEAVAHIAALELDVLIDLKGYTEGNHSEWLQYRLAPVQISWLGYPGTLGAPWVDYLVADEVVAPMEHQWMFSERLLHLPGAYQPNCRERACDPSPTRVAEGLPEDAIVLCSFNQIGPVGAKLRFHDI